MHCNIILRKPTPERLQLRIAGFFPRSVRTDRTGNLDAGWGRDVKMTVFIFNSLDESDGKSGMRSDVIDDRQSLMSLCSSNEIKFVIHILPKTKHSTYCMCTLKINERDGGESERRS